MWCAHGDSSAGTSCHGIPSSAPNLPPHDLTMTEIIPYLRCAVFALLPLLAGACSIHHPLVDGDRISVSEQQKTVRIKALREGDRTRFLVDNTEFCEVTVTFEFAVSNLTSNVGLPYTASFPARQITEAFALEPIEAGKPWHYSYTSYYKLGSHLARHDESCIYWLPYQSGHEYTVTQAYGGSYSHKGSSEYAIDWKMPEGTTVRAARAGVVVKIRTDSDKGGPSFDYDKYNNFVLIRHGDGTLAHYCHLQRGGNLVKVGDAVAVGQPIALSGNTGFSSGPHLHLCIFKTVSGRERVSLPVRFETTEDDQATLLPNHRYAAPKPGINMARSHQAAGTSTSSQGAAGD